MSARPEALSDGDNAFRASHVGASEVAALFDCSPYLTLFELWHRKNGTIVTPDFMADGMPNNERIEAGIRLEPAIIEWACDRWGYRRHETPLNVEAGGLGGHPDQMAYCPDRESIGVLEIKTADWLVAKKWQGEPPLHYLLQAQTYAGLTGSAWCDIVVLVGGNQLQRFQYDFRPGIFAEIEKLTADFWASMRANDPPPPDFTRDRAALEEVLGEPTEEVIDLRHDNEAAHLCCDWLAAKAEAKATDQRLEEIKTQLLMKIGDAGFALIEGYKIGANQTKGTPDREAKAGEIIKGRRGYRRFDVKEWEAR